MTSMLTTTLHVRSADGTRIAYDVTGSGPAVIVVDGALCHREFGPSRRLAAALTGVTVYAYDRRGRGDSGVGESPYRPEREVEDIAALVEAAGGSAALVGMSSGAILAADTATALTGVTGLVAYEPPFVTQADEMVATDYYTAALQAAASEGRGSDAATLFMRHVGVPAPVLAVMKLLPMWKKMAAVGPTLAHDLAVCGDTQSGGPLPTDRWSITTPALVLTGGKAAAYMANGNRAFAELVGAEHDVLPKQSHNVKPAVLAAAVTSFLAR